MARYSADPKLQELENKLWELQTQLAQATLPLQRRIIQVAIEQTRSAYRKIAQGQAFEHEPAN